MDITNNHSSDLGLPDGQLLPARQTTPVRNWDKIRDNAVVKAWLKAKILTEGGQVQPDKGELIAKLAALGVKVDGRSQIEKLQNLLAEAEAKRYGALNGSDVLPSHVQLTQDKSVQLGEVVRFAFDKSGLTLDEWNALATDDREAKLQMAVEQLKSEVATGLHTGPFIFEG